MPLIYHLKPRNMQGNTLMPLNQMKDSHPELYAKQVRKYQGRDALLKRKIPILNCLWNDVLFFAPVPPEAIKVAFENIIGRWQPARWLCVETDDIPMTAENAVIKLPDMTREQGDFTVHEKDYIPFDPDMLATIRTIPQHTLDYYESAHKAGQSVLAWHGIPQILYKDCIENINRFDCGEMI